jgi:hypothetical protein
VVDTARRAYALALRWYEALGWWQAPFWPALGWLIAIIVAIAAWVLAPHKLAHWVMPVIGSPKLPAWKWLAGVLTLFGYLGTTRRPLKAWLRKHRETLYEQNFAGRAPVKERERYCSLGHEDDITTFKRDVTLGKRTLLWVEGVGGSGKSSLAFQMFRGPIWDRKAAPVPILLDEDWEGSLVEHVAQLLKVGERSPTPEMVETLAAAGHLCLLVDSLSERGMANAAEQVAEAVAKGVFRSVVVTSREAAPSGQIWESFKAITARPLTVDQLPGYVATYAPEDRRDEILERIKQLFRVDKPMSPLFVRFAIEQALEGELASTSALDLVLKYVEALRAGKVNLSADDMIRAAAVAAREAVRESLVPREIGTDYLRGVLVHEADDMAFMDAAPKQPVDPATIIEMLVECGLLNRNRTNRRLRFAYDPVAELLAAYGIAQAPPREGVSELKSRILSAPDSAIAHAMEEIGGSLKVA